MLPFVRRCANQNAESCVSTSPLPGMGSGRMQSNAESRSVATNSRRLPRGRTPRAPCRNAASGCRAGKGGEIHCVLLWLREFVSTNGRSNSRIRPGARIQPNFLPAVAKLAEKRLDSTPSANSVDISRKLGTAWSNLGKSDEKTSQTTCRRLSVVLGIEPTRFTRLWTEASAPKRQVNTSTGMFFRHLKPPESYTREEWWGATKFVRTAALKTLPLHDAQGSPSVRRARRDRSTPARDRSRRGRPDRHAGADHQPADTQPVRHAFALPGSSDQQPVGRRGDDPRRGQGDDPHRTPPAHPGRTDDPQQLPDDATHRRVEGATARPGSDLRDASDGDRRHPGRPGSGGKTAPTRRADHGAGRDHWRGVPRPAPAESLSARVAALCDFANETAAGASQTPRLFVHPVVRAILLHFWLAYDHPFVDGNGRTARALFYWSMLRQKYWLFEFVSISEILLQSPAKYALSFLHTESDDNDITYFLIHQSEVICRAIESLRRYIERKSHEWRSTETLLRNAFSLNYRQQAIIGHALRHPGMRYTVEGHRSSHGIVHETARRDLMELNRMAGSK